MGDSIRDFRGYKVSKMNLAPFFLAFLWGVQWGINYMAKKIRGYEMA